jgi:glutamate synthase domain-containing protein 1
MNPEQYETKVRHLRAVVWWGDVAWVSALVDHDLVSQGRTPSESLRSLSSAAHMMVAWALQHGKGAWEDLERLDKEPRSVAAMAEWRARYETAVDLVADAVAHTSESYKATVEVNGERPSPSKTEPAG